MAVKYGGVLGRFKRWDVPLGESLLLRRLLVSMLKSRYTVTEFLKNL